jgi:endonuclease YncB( thermonuclease family)
MRRRGGSVAVLVVLLAASAAWLLKSNARGPLPVPPAGQSERIDAARLHVLDGDTVKYGDVTIRLLGIDAPERRSPHFPGDQEPHATKAKEYLEGLLARAKEVRFVRIADPDPHQRALAYLIADGVNVNAAMVRAGHAYENVSHFGEQGLKNEAQEVLAAAKGVRPAFEAPWRWRNRAKGQGAPR